jgi:hypothetical protein
VAFTSSKKLGEKWLSIFTCDFFIALIAMGFYVLGIGGLHYILSH